MKKNLIFKIVLSSIMASLSIVFEKLSISVGSTYKITFYSLPLILTSILFDYKIGLLSGLVVGFISQLTSQWGLSITTPLWMIAPICWGGLSGFICNLFKEKKYELKSISISIFITSIVVTLVNSLVIYLDSIILNYTSTQALIDIVIKSMLSLGLSIIYIIIIYLLCNRLKHMGWNKEINK